MRFNWEQNTNLGQTSTIGAGGGAPRFALIDNDKALIEAWASLPDHDRASLTPVGGMSNVVISDEGLPFAVVSLAANGLSFDGATVSADGGVAWDSLVEACTDRGIGGVELMSGIPGTVAGAPVQNIGAYGQALSDTLVSVDAFNKTTGEIEQLTAEDCRFAYRTSRFKTEGSWIVLRIRLQLNPSPPFPPITYMELAKELDLLAPSAPHDLRARREAVLKVRGRKGMLTGPNMPKTAGSFFKSPFIGRSQATEVARRVIGPDEQAFNKFLSSYGNQPDAEQVKVPAAQVLLASGFRNGDSWGSVGLSKRHIVAVENRGGATANDVSDVAAFIRSRTRAELDIDIEPEPIFLGQFPAADETAAARVAPLYRQAGSHTPDWVSTHSATYIDVSNRPD